MGLNPCQRCGACCAMFSVVFPLTEADDLPGGYVPVEMTGLLPGQRRIMLGTDKRNPKCMALSGIIGTRVACRIYNQRPSICREFEISWKNQRRNGLCDRARAIYGLDPFSP